MKSLKNFRRNSGGISLGNYWNILYPIQFKPARGKLWSRFMNVKAALRVAESHKENLSPKFRNGPKNSNSINYSKLLDVWKNTFLLRKELYKTNSVQNIYIDFSVLKTNHGIELVSVKHKSFQPWTFKIYSLNSCKLRFIFH